MLMIEVVIYLNFIRDLFIVMGEFLDNGVWVICIYIKLFVIWLWVGVVVMVIGGIFFISDKCYCMVKVKKIKCVFGGKGESDVE